MFVVLKLFNNNDVEEELEENNFYEIGLSKWLFEVDENMIGMTYWPPSNQNVALCVREERAADPKTWDKLRIEVKRYKETYIAARNTLNGIIKFSSAYETETEFGRGMRRKAKRKRILSSSDSEEEAVERKQVRLKSKIYNIPPPPFPPPPPSVPALESTSLSGLKNSQRSKNFENNAKAKKDQHNMPRTEIESSFPSRGNPKESRKSANSIQAGKQNVGLSSKKSTVITKLSAGARIKENAQKRAVKDSITMSSRDQLVAKLEALREKSKEKKIIDVSSSFVPQSSRNESSDYLDVDEESFLKANSLEIEESSVNEEDLSENMFQSKRSTGLSTLITQNDVEGYQTSAFSDSTLNCTPTESPIPISVFPYKSSGKDCNGSSIYQEKDIVMIHQMIRDLSSKVDIALMNINKLCRILMPHEKRITRPEGMPSLPLKTLKDFDMFEKFLEQGVNQSAMTDYLDAFPVPPKEYNATMCLLATVMTNGLASNFNFDGQKYKLGFQKTRLWKTIEATLLRKYEGSQLTDGFKAVKSWLRNAPWRLGGQGSLKQRANATI
ncbi:PREDICTED: uncharacterized protein LOC105556365 isoform X2 [Vollenhovia emeryi]|uniref:uncharacterized protein LOC105556365 isoform X2 n=1 Tax=Vollenhovia emeryi TaxID=411798 RepID=UPI0005F50379|nr:PREDICTED: uncharacterized protein LOC105556365 isoform X2 [Vollenhovia emeryi]